MDHVRAFGTILSGARMRQNKKLRQIAPLLEVSIAQVGSWESGTHLPPESRLEQIISVYELEKSDTLKKFALAKGQERSDRKAFKKLGKKEKDIDKKTDEQLFVGYIESTKDRLRNNQRKFISH